MKWKFWIHSEADNKTFLQLIEKQRQNCPHFHIEQLTETLWKCGQCDIRLDIDALTQEAKQNQRECYLRYKRK